MDSDLTAPHCLACKKEFTSPDGDPFCSSCVDAGWALAFRRGVTWASHTSLSEWHSRIHAPWCSSGAFVCGNDACRDWMRKHLSEVGPLTVEPQVGMWFAMLMINDDFQEWHIQKVKSVDDVHVSATGWAQLLLLRTKWRELQLAKELVVLPGTI